ncbi:MAG: hypothetical protein LBJ47_10705 [Tannerella sp.]|nr:hypothetical protein [Tannerella sp.]
MNIGRIIVKSNFSRIVAIAYSNTGRRSANAAGKRGGITRGRHTNRNLRPIVTIDNGRASGITANTADIRGRCCRHGNTAFHAQIPYCCAGSTGKNAGINGRRIHVHFQRMSAAVKSAVERIKIISYCRGNPGQILRQQKILTRVIIKISFRQFLHILF